MPDVPQARLATVLGRLHRLQLSGNGGGPTAEQPVDVDEQPGPVGPTGDRFAGSANQLVPVSLVVGQLCESFSDGRGAARFGRPEPRFCSTVGDEPPGGKVKPGQCRHRLFQSCRRRVVAKIGGSGHPGFQLPQASLPFGQPAAVAGDDRNRDRNGRSDVFQQAMQGLESLTRQAVGWPAADGQRSPGGRDPHHGGSAEARFVRWNGRLQRTAGRVPEIEQPGVFHG